MYSGSTEFNNLIEKPGGNALKTRFTFSDFSIENFTKLEYYGGSNNSNDIAIGTTNMAYLEVGTMTDRIITNREFLFEVGMELSDGTIEYAPMGYFTVQKPDSDEDEVNFTAYDRMQKFEKPYTSNLEYPTDSQKILYELCTMCEVQLATPILNPITITDKLEGYTCREVLGYIAGIHGLFACFDRYGKLNVRWYRSTPTEKQIGLIWSLTKSQSDFTVEKVTLAKDSETTYTSGSGGSRGINHSNPYATFDLAKSLYARLGGYTYRPCEISMLDDIRIDAWDTLKVTYLDGSVLTIPVMSLEHSFTSGETRVKSFGKTDTESEYRYSGPTTQAMDRMATELLVVNRVVATKVDAEYVQAHAITTDNLSAIEAEITSAVIEQVSADYADIRFANIDTANINKEKVKDLFVETGLIKDAIIVNGKITGYLDAVEINAASITSGTLIADRIMIKDENGDYWLYSANEQGEIIQSKLDGNIIKEHTIGADHIIANSITANEIAAESITLNELNVDSMLSVFVDKENLISEINASADIISLKANRFSLESDNSKIATDGTAVFKAGTIADFTFNNEELIYVDNEIHDGFEYTGGKYKTYSRISTSNIEKIDIGAGTSHYYYFPRFELGYINIDYETGEEGNKVATFSADMFGAHINRLYVDGVVCSDLVSNYRYKESTPEGFIYTHYDLGAMNTPWENIYGKNIYSTGDVIANFGETNQIALSSLIPKTAVITAFQNSFGGNITAHDTGKHRDLQCYLIAGKALSAATWYNVCTFPNKPLSTCRAIVVANTNTYTPVVVELQSTGLLRIYPRVAMAKNTDIRFTLSFATE